MSVYFTSESVTEGHPDKICDNISDAVLDAALTGDPKSRVACETSVTTGLVLVAGEITTEAQIDFQSLVRGTIREIGYDDAQYGFDCDTCAVLVALDKQSPDISQGVSQALEKRSGSTEDPYAGQGAGDQGMMFGFACDETDVFMPLPIHLAHRLAETMTRKRKEGELPYLRPDGKSQVTVRYENGKPAGVSAIVLSSQHDDKVSASRIQEDFRNKVIPEAIPHGLLDKDMKLFVNPTGRFVVGGPMGDAGLTGRKIIVDTYGGYARHGGGAFSGKDPSKVDRSAAYMARYIAKNLVAAGAAAKLEIQVSYAIGVATPLSVFVETFGTHKADPLKIEKAVRELFDLRPGAFIDKLDLRRPIYRKTAAYGHFGRELPEFTWEKTDRVEDVRSALGL